MGNKEKSLLEVYLERIGQLKKTDTPLEKKKNLYNFSLHIGTDWESITRFDNDTVLPGHSCMEKNILFLTGALLRSFYKILSPNNFNITPLPSTEDTYSTLRNFYAEVTGQNEIVDEALPVDIITKVSFPENYKKDEDFYITVNFLMEVHTLLHAIRFWLHPKEGQNIVSLLFKEPWLTRKYTGFFQLRCSEFTTWPILSEGKFTRIYESHGILPLCWAEIWNAIERGVKAGLCPYCWDIYLYPPNNYQKAHCGRDKCKKAHIISQQGGKEGYREWERTRKNMPEGTKRQRGRPKKDNTNKKGGS